MMRASTCGPLILSVALFGCASAPPLDPEVPEPGELSEDDVDPVRRAVALQYRDTVDQVASMVADPDLARAAADRGLHIVDLTWEDTGRAEGSALGPNISDLTLQVRRRGPGGAYADALMPVVRFPNFTDLTADVPSDRFFVRVGNHAGRPLETVARRELLSDMGRFVSAPASMAGAAPAGAATAPGTARLDLGAARDTHYLVSAQAVFLPIPRAGKAEFNPVVFNYQSAPGSPAVLAILATREGTSVKVIENRTEERGAAHWGQELYFNDAGHRAAFSAERRSDVASRIAAQGGPKSEADRSALGRGADVIALIQVPLVHEHRGWLGGLASDGYGYEFSDDPLAAGGFGPNDATIRVRPGPVRTSGMERAVMGHGPRLGPFVEGHGGRLVRDARFPIRITVQFYKATSDGVVSEADFDSIARNIGSVYEHAAFVGSLVVPENDAKRPTAWQTIPHEWFPW